MQPYRNRKLYAPKKRELHNPDIDFSMTLIVDRTPI
jgi:hypothetical protein